MRTINAIITCNTIDTKDVSFHHKSQIKLEDPSEHISNKSMSSRDLLASKIALFHFEHQIKIPPWGMPF